MYQSIQKLQDKQDQIEKNYYKKMIKSIKSTIVLAIQNNQQKCFYQVPIFSFGEPINDIDYVIKVLKKHLKKEHVKLIQIEGILIHLDWSKIEKKNSTDLDILYKRYL